MRTLLLAKDDLEVCVARRVICDNNNLAEVAAESNGTEHAQNKVVCISAAKRSSGLLIVKTTTKRNHPIHAKYKRIKHTLDETHKMNYAHSTSELNTRHHDNETVHRDEAHLRM